MRLRLLRELITADDPPELPSELDALAAAARDHRLAPLIVARWAVTTGRGGDLARMLREDAVRLAARDMRQTAALAELLDHVDRDLLVFKGSALGPLLYGRSELRPRWDIDVWTDGWESARHVAARLEELDFRQVHQLPGEFVPHAITLRRGRSDDAVDVDVHARCSARHRVAAALPFGDSFERAVSFEFDGHRARTVCDRDGWLLAALHLAAHHADETPPLIMLEDLRRLSNQLTERDWRETWDVAIEHELTSALKHALRVGRAWGLELPRQFAEAVAAAPADASARFSSTTEALLDDLDVLDGGDARRYLSELLFPPAGYLYEHYGVSKNRPPALLSSHRLVSGLVRTLGR